MKYLFLIILLSFFFSCKDERKKSGLDVTNYHVSVEIEEDSIPVLIPETHDIPEGVKPWSTYWYVTYDTHIANNDVRYNGYTVIVLETPYFDIEQAIKQIVPKYTTADYVGINFFQLVPVETYKAFKRSNL